MAAKKDSVIFDASGGEGRVVRFRCHAGQAFAAKKRLQSTAEEVESQVEARSSGT